MFDLPTAKVRETGTRNRKRNEEERE